MTWKKLMYRAFALPATVSRVLCWRCGMFRTVRTRPDSCAGVPVRLVPTGGRTKDHLRAGRPARALASMTALVAGLLTVAGCQTGTSSTATPTFSGGNNIVRVAETPGVGDAPLFLAFQQGLFRKAGLEVNIKNYGSTRDELTALRAGAADVAFGDYADTFYAQALAQAQAKGRTNKNSLNLVIVADGY